MENKNYRRNSTEYFIQDIIYHLAEWLKRLWIIILVLAVVGSAGLTYYTYASFVPSYEAKATFTVNVDVQTSSAQSYNKATANQLAKTFPNIITSSSLTKIACHDLGVENLGSSTISASVIEDTNLFTIKVNANNPQFAYDVLQSVINNYPEVARFVIGSTQLNLIDTSEVSTMPTNIPSYSTKAILGCVGGAMIGIVVILLLALTTTTVIRADDFENYFNVTCLGSVPELTKKKRSKKQEDEIPNVEISNVNYKFRESVFTIRNSVIRKCKKNGYKSVVVTSTISGEGKSVIAMNLAHSIALKGYKTCLVDFDLRVPSIAQYMNIDNEINNVSDYIKGNIGIKNCVYSTKLENFYIALETKNNDDASELIANEKAKDLINKLTELFEFVIIDSPPTGYLADASVIGDYVDSAVYVVAQDICSRRVISNGLTNFNNLNADVIGCVLNRITKGIESVGYGKYLRRYGYRKYGYDKYAYNKNNDDSSADLNQISSFNGVEFED